MDCVKNQKGAVDYKQLLAFTLYYVGWLSFVFTYYTREEYDLKPAVMIFEIEYLT